jgi:hypothetical protein
MDMIGGNSAIIYHDVTCIKQNKYFHLGGGTPLDFAVLFSKVFSTIELLNQKPPFSLQKCAKIHLRQSRKTKKISWGNTPDPRFKGRGWEG